MACDYTIRLKRFEECLIIKDTEMRILQGRNSSLGIEAPKGYSFPFEILNLPENHRLLAKAQKYWNQKKIDVRRGEVSTCTNANITGGIHCDKTLGSPMILQDATLQQLETKSNGNILANLVAPESDWRTKLADTFVCDCDLSSFNHTYDDGDIETGACATALQTPLQVYTYAHIADRGEAMPRLGFFVLDLLKNCLENNGYQFKAKDSPLLQNALKYFITLDKGLTRSFKKRIDPIGDPFDPSEFVGYAGRPFNQTITGNDFDDCTIQASVETKRLIGFPATVSNVLVGFDEGITTTHFDYDGLFTNQTASGNRGFVANSNGIFCFNLCVTYTTIECPRNQNLGGGGGTIVVGNEVTKKVNLNFEKNMKCGDELFITLAGNMENAASGYLDIILDIDKVLTIDYACEGQDIDQVAHGFNEFDLKFNFAVYRKGCHSICRGDNVDLNTNCPTDLKILDLVDGLIAQGFIFPYDARTKTVTICEREKESRAKALQGAIDLRDRACNFMGSKNIRDAFNNRFVCLSYNRSIKDTYIENHADYNENTGLYGNCIEVHADKAGYTYFFKNPFGTTAILHFEPLASDLPHIDYKCGESTGFRILQHKEKINATDVILELLENRGLCIDVFQILLNYIKSVGNSNLIINSFGSYNGFANQMLEQLTGSIDYTYNPQTVANTVVAAYFEQISTGERFDCLPTNEANLTALAEFVDPFVDSEDINFSKLMYLFGYTLGETIYVSSPISLTWNKRLKNQILCGKKYTFETMISCCEGRNLLDFFRLYLLEIPCADQPYQYLEMQVFDQNICTGKTTIDFWST